eukprot:4684766-Pyramimonas_sp.AAC.1
MVDVELHRHHALSDDALLCANSQQLGFLFKLSAFKAFKLRVVRALSCYEFAQQSKASDRHPYAQTPLTAWGNTHMTRRRRAHYKQQCTLKRRRRALSSLGSEKQLRPCGRIRYVGTGFARRPSSSRLMNREYSKANMNDNKLSFCWPFGFIRST